MAFVKMKPPAGVTVGLGSDGKQYYVNDRGFANVDSSTVTKLTNEGWSSVTDMAPGAVLETVKAITDPVNGGIGLLLGDKTVYPVDTQVSRIKASIAAAFGSNPQINAPICAAPTWQAGTTYYTGQVVRGAAVGSTDNVYFMVGSTSSIAFGATGTSAASGGPTGTADGIITDGTCAWLYVSKATATDAVNPLYSTATLTNSASAMNGYVQTISAATATAIGLTAYTPYSVTGSAATEMYITGGLYSDRYANRVNGPNQGSVGTPNYSQVERNHFRFSTNSRKWIGLGCTGASFNRASDVQIVVNGRRLSEASYKPENTNNVMLLDLSKFPDGEKVIDIRYYTDLKYGPGYTVYLEQDAAIWPAKNPNAWRIGFDGDSITAGGYTQVSWPRYWLDGIVADLLGASDHYNNAVGGTGAINNLSGAKTTYLERLADLTAFSPDVIVIGGFHNDVGNSGSYTSATRQAAFLAYFQAVRAGNPNAHIFVIGTQLLGGETTAAGAANQYQVEVDAKAAFDTWADRKSKFIPLLTALKPKIASAAGKFYIVGGSTPYNNTHPLNAYYPFIGGYIAGAIREYFDAI